VEVLLWLAVVLVIGLVRLLIRLLPVLIVAVSR
jgi:hypothetical protein